MAKRARVDLKLNTEDLKLAAVAGLDEALFAAGEVVAAAVKSRAPKRTGKLANSVYVATPKRSTYTTDDDNEKERKPEKGEVVVGVASFHAHFIEAGTSKMAAKPFFRPAFDATRRQAAQVAADKLRESLERA